MTRTWRQITSAASASGVRSHGATSVNLYSQRSNLYVASHIRTMRACLSLLPLLTHCREEQKNRPGKYMLYNKLCCGCANSVWPTCICSHCSVPCTTCATCTAYVHGIHIMHARIQEHCQRPMQAITHALTSTGCMSADMLCKQHQAQHKLVQHLALCSGRSTA